MGKKYTLASGASLYAQANSTEFQIANSTGLLYSQEKPIFMPNSTVFNPYAVEAIATGSSEGSTLTAYGVSMITAVAGANSSALTVNLAAPITGVQKTLVVSSTADLGGNLNVSLGSASLQMATSDAGFSFITFSTLGTMQSLSLVGLSTAKWGLIAANSTGGVWGAATGIRATTALSS